MTCTQRIESTGKLSSTIFSAVIILLAASPGAALADRWGWSESTPQLKMDGTQMPGGCPIESPGGLFLFTARNPGTGIDIYVNQRASIEAPFEAGAPLPFPANDPDLANDFCPTPLPDGGLYFVSTRSGGCDGADIHRTVNNPATGWAVPENLGCEPDGPNTPGTEFSPSVVTTIWGTFLFFSSDYHTGNQDIYVSRQRPDGSFGPGERLGWPINTEYDDRQPNVSQDGREIVFASNRPSSNDDESGFDIFYARRGSLFARWARAVNLSETVPFATVDAGETRPSMSWDGKRLVYGAGGVWVSERSR